jgi:PAS domain-containing protein
MFASERAMRIAGIESGVVVRTPDEWLALLDIHPDDLPAVKRTFRRQPQGGSQDAQEADCRVRQGDGSWRWVRLRGRHLCDPHGRATRWSGSISDIDAHKRTEQALRESQERYQLAVAGSNEGMWDWDMRKDLFLLGARPGTARPGAQRTDAPVRGMVELVPLPLGRREARARRVEGVPRRPRRCALGGRVPPPPRQFGQLGLVPRARRRAA